MLIWGGREGNCFCGRGWTGQIALNWWRKLVFWRSGQDEAKRVQPQANDHFGAVIVPAKLPPPFLARASSLGWYRSSRNIVESFLLADPSLGKNTFSVGRRFETFSSRAGLFSPRWTNLDFAVPTASRSCSSETGSQQFWFEFTYAACRHCQHQKIASPCYRNITDATDLGPCSIE